MQTSRSRFEHLLMILGTVTVNYSAPVSPNVDAAVKVGITGDHKTGVVPLVSAVVDLCPAGSAVDRPVEATGCTDLACEIDGRVGLSTGGHSEADGIRKSHVCQFRETCAAIGRMP